MTMPVGTGNNRQANVTVSANVDPFVASMNVAQKSVTAFGSALQKIDQTILKITKMAGATAIGGGLISIFADAKSTQQAAQFQQSMSALAAQSAVTGTSLKGLGDNIQRLSTQVPIASNNLAQLATQIAALGVRGTQQITQLTMAATKLAAATNTAPGQLMTGLISMSQSLGTGVSNVERYGSALTALQQNMGVSAQGILDFAGGIEAVANKAGIGQASILGLSAAFQKVGADGFAGAQAFNTVMNDMTDAVSRNNARMLLYANTLGMTSKAFSDLVKTNPAQAFTDFVNAIAALGPKSQAALEQFGLDGVRTQRVFAALTSGQADLQGALNQSNAAFAENTATAKGAAAAWNTFDDAVQKLHNSVQVTQQAFGQGFLTVLTPVVEMFGTLAKAAAAVAQGLNHIPLLGGASGWAATAAGVALAAGAFAILFASMTKVMGVWRMMSGALGGSAIRGGFAGITGANMAPLEGASRSQMFLYRNAYNAGGMLRGRQTAVSSLDGLGGVARSSMVSRVARFPLTRAQQMWRQTADTMAHPINFANRNPMATDPWSVYGAYQAGERGVRSTQDRMAGFFTRPGASSFEQQLGNRIASPYGNVESSRQRLVFDRARNTSDAYNLARNGQVNAIGRMSRANQERLLMAVEAEQYQAQGISNYNPTNFGAMGRRDRSRALNRAANWRGQQAAGLAGDEFDKKLSTAETERLASPFAKLAAKVKTISAELATDTQKAFGAVTDGIVAMYQAAVNKITALTQLVQAELAKLRGMATGAGTVTMPMSGMPPVPPNRMTGMPSVPGGPTGPPPQPGMVWSNGTTKRNPGWYHPTPGGGMYPPGYSPTANPEGLGRITVLPPVPPAGGRSPQEIADRVVTGGRGASEIEAQSNRLATALRNGTSTIGTTLSRMGSTLFAFISSPWMIGLAIFGPLLFSALSKIGDALKQVTPTLAYAGAEIQQALGRQYMTPEQQDKQKALANASSADKDAFGKTEVTDAMSPNFAGSHGNTLSQLDALKGNGAQDQAFLQQQVNQVVRNNNGNPLDSAAQQQIRYLAIRAAGGDAGAAQRMFNNLDLSGASNPQLYTGELDSLYKMGGFAQWGAGKDLLNSVSSSATTDYQSGNPNSLAYLLARGGQEGAKGDSWQNTLLGFFGGGLLGVPNVDPGSSTGFANLFNHTINDLNNGKSDKEKIDPGKVHFGQNTSAGDFNQGMDSLRTGNQAAKDLFNELKSALTQAGIKVDNLGHVADLTSTDLTKLATAAGSITAKTPEQTAQQKARRNTLANSIYTSEINPADAGKDVSSLLQNDQDVWFNANLRRLNQNLINGDNPSQGRTSHGSADIGIASPQFISGLQNAIVEIERLKATLGGPGDKQWQVLDKLEQTNLAQLQGAAQSQLSPGAAVKAMADTLQQEMAAAPVDKTNVDSYQAQIDNINSAQGQLLATMKQGYVAQYEYNRQTERAQEDHYRQMAIMQRDYNRQVAEANYQFNIQQQESNYQYGIQQREAAYQYNLQQTEALYQYSKQQQESAYEFQYSAQQRQHSFDETVRSMKYSIANSLGTPGSLVQAQYTMGADQAMAGFAQQTADLKTSLDSLNKLQGMGLSQDAIRVFKLDDPTNFAQAQRYLTDFISNPALVKSFNDAVAKNLNISQALATNPGNSQFADLQRQFDYTAEQASTQFAHAAQLASESFGHAQEVAGASYQHSVDLAAESFSHGQQLSSDSFAHSMEQSAISFQTSMSDFETQYNISLARAAQDLADQFNFITIATDTLVNWAKDSGIPGLQDIANQFSAVAAQVQAAQALIEAARGQAMTTPSSDSGSGSGGYPSWYDPSTGKAKPGSAQSWGYIDPATGKILSGIGPGGIPNLSGIGGPGTALGNLSGANFGGIGGVNWGAVAGALGANGFGGTAAPGGGAGGQMGNSLPMSQIPGLNNALAGVAQQLGTTNSAWAAASNATDVANQKIAVYKASIADSSKSTAEQQKALDEATAAIKNQVTATGNAVTANDQGKDAATQNKDATNAQHDAFLALTTQLGFVPPGLQLLGQHLGVTDANLGTTSTNVGILHTGIQNLPDHTVTISAETVAAAGAIMDFANYAAMVIGQVIDRVINGGLINAWNSVVAQLGLPTSMNATPVMFNPFIISALNNKGSGSIGGGGGKPRGFATGGYTGDGGKHDPAGIVHAGEFVITKEKTEKFRPLLEAIHAAPGYASGGPVATWPQLDAIRAQMFPGSVLTSAYRPGANDYHGLGEAIDIGVPGNVQSGLMPIAAALAQRFPNSTELIHNPNGSIKNGQPVPSSFWGASTWAQHANHVHWAMTAEALAGAGSAVAAMFDPVGYIVSALQANAGQQGRGMSGLQNAMANRYIQVAQNELGAKLSGYLGSFGAPGQAYTGSGSVQSIVQSIAGTRGWGSGAEWNALAALVNSESGFNPNAQNPSSTAYGLFQFLNGTWAGTGIGKTSDPGLQTQAGLTYIGNRYGDPISAWNFHKAHGWYANGGVFNGAQTIGVGESGPEAVLPLNATGAHFMAQTLQASLQRMGVNAAVAEEVRRGRTSGYASPARSEMHYHHTDASTNFSGDITVVAQDPNEMARKLAAQQRLAALSRPVAKR